MNKGLCHRCEHRAKYIEEGYAIRCECKTLETSSGSCYAYKPTQPINLKANENDDRPMFAGSMLSSRSHRVHDIEMKLVAWKNSYGTLLFWIPEKFLKAIDNLEEILGGENER